jgi:valyl-tRNA synthetase
MILFFWVARTIMLCTSTPHLCLRHTRRTASLTNPFLQVLKTGHDKLFFWVARMIMMGCEHHV